MEKKHAFSIQNVRIYPTSEMPQFYSEKGYTLIIALFNSSNKCWIQIIPLIFIGNNERGQQEAIQPFYCPNIEQIKLLCLVINKKETLVAKAFNSFKLIAAYRYLTTKTDLDKKIEEIDLSQNTLLIELSPFEGSQSLKLFFQNFQLCLRINTIPYELQ